MIRFFLEMHLKLDQLQFYEKYSGFVQILFAYWVCFCLGPNWCCWQIRWVNPSKNQIAKMPNRTSRVRMQIGMQNGYTSAHICTSLVRCLLESLLQLNFFSFI